MTRQLLTLCNLLTNTALGIKSAAENEAFQEEVLEMRRTYDPNFEEPDTVITTVPIAAPDTASSN